jgi:hypothetical protein
LCCECTSWNAMNPATRQPQHCYHCLIHDSTSNHPHPMLLCFLSCRLLPAPTPASPSCCAAATASMPPKMNTLEPYSATEWPMSPAGSAGEAGVAAQGALLLLLLLLLSAGLTVTTWLLSCDGVPCANAVVGLGWCKQKQSGVSLEALAEGCHT